MGKDGKKTLLNGWHISKGATMAIFAGYDMPLWYASAKEEHLSVLRAAGMFDTSHMAVLTIEGEGAFDLLQKTFTQNLSACIGKNKSPISIGRCVYGAFLNETGEVIDDSIIYRTDNSSYMVVVNAGMGGVIAEHLSEYKNNTDITIIDWTDKLGKIDIQGPMAAKIMRGMLKDPEKIFTHMPYFSFKGNFDGRDGGTEPVVLKNGVSILFSRTGYTGELGFEVFMDSKYIIEVWEQFLEAGEPYGLLPCGLAARDSLRAGAVLPLSHQDIGHWKFINHPWIFALPYNDKNDGFTKSFVGSAALLQTEQSEFTYPFAGQDLRKVSLSDNPVVLHANGKEIGRVLTCVTDMGIGRIDDKIISIASPDKPEDFAAKGLCCGFIMVKSALSFGEKVFLQDKRRKLPVTVVADIRPHRTARKPLSEMLLMNQS